MQCRAVIINSCNAYTNKLDLLAAAVSEWKLWPPFLPYQSSHTPLKTPTQGTRSLPLDSSHLDLLGSQFSVPWQILHKGLHKGVEEAAVPVGTVRHSYVLSGCCTSGSSGKWARGSFSSISSVILWTDSIGNIFQKIYQVRLKIKKSFSFETGSSSLLQCHQAEDTSLQLSFTAASATSGSRLSRARVTADFCWTRSQAAASAGFPEEDFSKSISIKSWTP